MKNLSLYLDITKRVALESKCKRLQVGAIIVKDLNIISYGYNGTPAGFNNTCECTKTNTTLPEVIHAEANALIKASKSTISTNNATIICTHSCCTECAKLIIQSGIKEFIFLHHYRNTSGITLLQKAGIDTLHINPQL